MNTATASIHRRTTRLRALLFGLVALAAASAVSRAARAQDEPFVPLSAAELAELVGPVALYPDEILGIVLPASTYPLQIVEAARFLDERASNPNAVPDDDWDDSVVALLNYPEVVHLMNDDLDWTWALGEAVLNDEAAVLDAVQNFRDQAYAAGNLRSDDRQVVTQSDGVIEIAPADPEVVYIPYYEPARVVVYQPLPVYHYYPIGYPLYYYPYPASYRFGVGFFWGVTSAFTIGWHSHLLHVYHHTHFGHPYYSWNYYTPYYYRSRVNVTVNVNNYRDVWRPRRSRGARPYDGYRARSESREGRTYDGRRYRYGGGGTRDYRLDGRDGSGRDGRRGGTAARTSPGTRNPALLREPRNTRDGVAGRGPAVRREPGTVDDRRVDRTRNGARPSRDSAPRSGGRRLGDARTTDRQNPRLPATGRTQGTRPSQSRARDYSGGATTLGRTQGARPSITRPADRPSTASPGLAARSQPRATTSRPGAVTRSPSPSRGTIRAPSASLRAPSRSSATIRAPSRSSTALRAPLASRGTANAPNRSTARAAGQGATRAPSASRRPPSPARGTVRAPTQARASAPSAPRASARFQSPSRSAGSTRSSQARGSAPRATRGRSGRGSSGRRQR